ncbi:MAG: acyl-CoA synthetase FdrA [Caldilineaceae bacterium]|nr:acyl-CoA synthetase FdrA [Caldilineaceae bacterium]
MSMTQHEVRRGAYYDSIVLMQLQKALAELEGVLDAGVVMATPANRDVLDAAGFAVEAIDARPDDLLIMVKAESEGAASAALAQVDELLKRRQGSGDMTYRPASLDAAARQLPHARWTLISVPGRYAAAVARQALALNTHVFLYSDNVSLEDEIDLKRRARDAGLLVMGPDCGTAIINGVGLGFANRVRRGGIGIVAASGTGLQAVSSGVHNLGGGVSQAFGTGGRDLKADVGGLSALQALDLLRRDPATEVIVLVSKPPAPSVATRLLRAARECEKLVIVNLLGYAPPARRTDTLHFALNLHDAAELAVTLQAETRPEKPAPGREVSGYVRGLFSGGTLAYEALLGLQPFLAPLYSNAPVTPEQKLVDSFASQAHTILDLGEDQFTQGRLHPMMDNDLRLRRLRTEAGDAAVGTLLLDVVLGEGAHPDPAGELAPALAEAKAARPELDVVVVVVGTDADPQVLDEQAAQFTHAGAHVYPTVTDAVRHIVRRLPRESAALAHPLSLDDFGSDLAAINVGLESFHASLIEQGAQSIQVDWRPPAGGNERLAGILARLG